MLKCQEPKLAAKLLHQQISQSTVQISTHVLVLWAARRVEQAASMLTENLHELQAQKVDVLVDVAKKAKPSLFDY
jgi:hypothetical protein